MGFGGEGEEGPTTTRRHAKDPRAPDVPATTRFHDRPMSMVADRSPPQRMSAIDGCGCVHPVSRRQMEEDRGG
jgi:hypothetical protein